jgi:hypothetical protein
MPRRILDALLIAYAVVLLIIMAPVRRGVTYDTRTGQTTMPTCETCKLIDPDHCWTCWITYYGNGCGMCPTDSGIAATLARR